jgi:hypothetical protein
MLRDTRDCTPKAHTPEDDDARPQNRLPAPFPPSMMLLTGAAKHRKTDGRPPQAIGTPAARAA